MKAQDFMDQNNNRAEAVRRITAFCDANGYSYKYTEKSFRIILPTMESLPITPARVVGRRKKEVDTSSWGPPGPVEGEEEQLPPVGPLEEGKPPDAS
jgi:hypothetical protein